MINLPQCPHRTAVSPDRFACDSPRVRTPDGLVTAEQCRRCVWRPAAGLGDTVAQITGALGILPCDGCHERRAWLNRVMPYRPRAAAGWTPWPDGDLVGVIARLAGRSAEEILELAAPQGEPVPMHWAPPADMARVTFGVTAFERPAHLERLVASIRRCYPGASIVVADNGRKRARLPADVRLIELPFDCGLSAARNALIDACETEFLLVLEEDFLFTAESSIERFVDVLDHDPSLGFAGGSLWDAGELLDHAGEIRQADGRLVVTPARTPLEATAAATTFRRCDKVFNFVLCRRAALADHRWDEALKLAEHLPFFLDVQRLGKWGVAHVPEVRAVHDRTGRDAHYLAHRRRSAELRADWQSRQGLRIVDRLRAVPARAARRTIPEWLAPRWKVSRLKTERPNVVILGVGHSGTSILTRMLGALGWQLGDADEEFCESVSIREANQRYLAAGHPIDSSLLAALPTPWAVKDPRFVLTLDRWEWRPYDPLLVWITRDEEAVIASYLRRGQLAGRDPQAWYRARLARAADQFTRWPGPKITLRYEDLAAACALFQPRTSRS